MADLNYDARPDRICVSCGQTDKAPRDSVGLPDGSVALFHKDCHALLGCKVCQEELDAIANGAGPKGLKNEKLTAAILTEMGKPKIDQHPVYTRDDVTGAYQAALETEAIQDKNWSPS
jgi:hypothetical protein